MIKRNSNRTCLWAFLLLAFAAGATALLLAQTQPAAFVPPAADVQALAVQCAPGFEYIALLDKQNQTLCIYTYDPRAPANERLRLVAARSYIFDVQLQDYNNAEPAPATVRDWVERAASLRRAAESRPPDAPTAGAPSRTAPSDANTPQPPAASRQVPSPAPAPPAPKASATPAAAAPPARPPARDSSQPIPLKCVNPACDFALSLALSDLSLAATQQLAQVAQLDPVLHQRYLATGRRLCLEEAQTAGDAPAGEPVLSPGRIQHALISRWGSPQYRLPFLCPRCGENAVYRASVCPRCHATFVPPLGQPAPDFCPKCAASTQPAGNDPGISP